MGITRSLTLPFFLLSCSGSGEKEQWGTDSLSEALFKTPERDYYPETWFHYIGGNVSKPGITADLEAIAQAVSPVFNCSTAPVGVAWRFAPDPIPERGLG